MTLSLTSVTSSIVKLLPNGNAWDKSTSSNLFQTMQFFAAGIKRAIDFADYSLQDTFPATTQQSLSAWQASVGLPDPGYPGTLTQTQQKNQMIARLSNLGGQSPRYYIAYAQALGFNITIQELSVPRSGISKAGACQCNAAGADHVWNVYVANGTAIPFHAGDLAGSLLETYTDISLLKFEFAKIKPAHTLICYYIV